MPDKAIRTAKAAESKAITQAEIERIKAVLFRLSNDSISVVPVRENGGNVVVLVKLVKHFFHVLNVLWVVKGDVG